MIARLAASACVLAGMLAWTAAPAVAQMAPAAQRGRSFVTTNCARCHSVDKYTASPLAIAPPFRTLHEKYPVEDLAESLAEGILVGHPTMPRFQLDPGQVGDVITYLETLE
jgi:cytochrome c